MKTVLKKSNVTYLFVAQATLNFSSRGDSRKKPAAKRSNDLLRRPLIVHERAIKCTETGRHLSP